MHNVYRVICLFAVLAVYCSCDNMEQKARNTINKTGETVGRGTTEFVKGIKEGIDKTLQCKVEPGTSLTNKGIRTGKFYISNSTNANENIVTIYFIFDQDFNHQITAKVFDRNGQEYGRTTINVQEKAGTAKYIDFVFDRRTEIESKSLFTLE